MFSKLKHFFNPYIKVRKSSIHSNGVFAKKDIKKGTRILEYLGEIISKKESERRADKTLDKSKKNKNKGAVYIFDLDKKRDIDGDTWYNLAKYINHSCDPNCETIDEDGHIFIEAIKNIKKGEELSFDYGYEDLEDYEEHPCKCGSKNCCGYIIKENKRAKLKELLKKNSK